MSQKLIAEKLQIKENCKVLLVNEPKDYMLSLGKLPLNVTVTVKLSEKPFDIVQVFVNSRRELEEKLSPLKPLLAGNGLLWVTYPKGTANAKTDVNRDSIREYAQTLGLQAVSLVAIDRKLSALRLKIVS